VTIWQQRNGQHKFWQHDNDAISLANASATHYLGDSQFTNWTIQQYGVCLLVWHCLSAIVLPPAPASLCRQIVCLFYCHSAEFSHNRMVMSQNWSVTNCHWTTFHTRNSKCKALCSKAYFNSNRCALVHCWSQQNSSQIVLNISSQTAVSNVQL